MGSGGNIGTGVYAWGELGVVEMAFSARRPAEAPEGLSRETGGWGAGGETPGCRESSQATKTLSKTSPRNSVGGWAGQGELGQAEGKSDRGRKGQEGALNIKSPIGAPQESLARCYHTSSQRLTLGLGGDQRR